MYRVNRSCFAKVPYSKLFRHSAVVANVFAADGRKVAFVEERPGLDIRSYTFGRLQRDILFAADAVAASGAVELPDPSPSSRGPSVFGRQGRLTPADEAARRDTADDGHCNVALLCRPSYEFVVGLLAVWSLNLMVVPMCDQHHYDGEMTHVLENSRARLMLADKAMRSSKLPPSFSAMTSPRADGVKVFDVSSCIDMTDIIAASSAVLDDSSSNDNNSELVVEQLDPLPQHSANISTTVDLLARMEHFRESGKAKSDEEVQSEIAARFVERNKAPFAAPQLISFDDSRPEKLNKFYRQLLTTFATSPPSSSDALMIFTSGTTAKPKGVVHTHSSVSNQVSILRQAWRWSDADTILLTLPLHHVHGLVNVLLCSLASAATCIYTPFDNPARIATRLMRGDISVYMAVPTIYTKLIEAVKKVSPVEQTAFRKSLSAGLRLMVSGSAALPVPVLEQFREASGHVLLERYGMTEVGMALSQPYLPVSKRAPGTVGLPLPSVTARVIGNKEEESSPGSTATTGRLVLSSASLFDRYWRNAAATLAEVFVCPSTGQRFFETGDTVQVDEEGNYMILGRTSVDIIKRSGYKLSALEIEAALLLAKSIVAEVAVFGVAHPSLGEAVVAVVAPTPDAISSSGLFLRAEGGDFVIGRSDGPSSSSEASGCNSLLESLKDVAKTNLAPYKCPSAYVLVSSIPRNAMGKVNKKELKKKLFPVVPVA